MNDESFVLVERDEARKVALLRFNRPKQLNAMNGAVMDQLCAELEGLDRDDAIRVMVVTGNERAFAAGADIGEMATASPIDMLRGNRIAQWDRVRRISKPVIAAVAGWCLGGGCELAMALDLIIAAESAMEMILTGEPIDAREAHRLGLVARVVPNELLVEDALALAAAIATKSPVAVRVAKEAVNAAYEMSLTDALAHERRLFYLLFASDDQKEGMAAFLEKRPPDFKGR